MARGRTRVLSALAALCFVFGSRETLAQEGVRLHGTAAGARAISGHQKDELGFGVVGLAAVELPVATPIGLELELGSLWLSEADAPEDPRIAPGGAGSSVHGALGARVRPLADPLALANHGPWLAAHFGGARTGGLTRPMFDAAVGWDFAVSERVGLGPTAGLIHVFQPDDELRPADANVVFLGIHGVLDLTKKKVDGDRDQDGIKDSIDRCPEVPEDKDGFEDQDGCPDLDNDRDKILDRDDRCPLDPEDKDGFEDRDGCPEKDNDLDGILDASDKCPTIPEDKDGFEDEDGCPDKDNDKDGILDKEDLCPDEPETVNGYADNDGCPDSEQVRVIGDKIVLDDRVHFWTNSAQLRPASYPLLERVAEVIRANPTYVHIEVQGHTDERGPAGFNQKLSQGRSESVMQFLISKGIAKERLSAKGFGADKPLVDKKGEHAWFMNRRVEFAITRERTVKEAAP
jgi:outer membrane protein OmpA-like peptidoglycan-associated protein